MPWHMTARATLILLFRNHPLLEASPLNDLLEILQGSYIPGVYGLPRVAG